MTIFAYCLAVAEVADDNSYWHKWRAKAEKTVIQERFLASLMGNAKLAWSIAPGEKLEIAYTKLWAKWKGKNALLKNKKMNNNTQKHELF